MTPGSPAITFFRVDILKLMGPSLVAAAVVWGRVRHRVWLTLCSSGLAAAIAMATPLILRDPPLRHRLTLAQAGGAYVLFCALM